MREPSRNQVQTYMRRPYDWPSEEFEISTQGKIYEKAFCYRNLGHSFVPRPGRFERVRREFQLADHNHPSVSFNREFRRESGDHHGWTKRHLDGHLLKWCERRDHSRKSHRYKRDGSDGDPHCDYDLYAHGDVSQWSSGAFGDCHGNHHRESPAPHDL